MKFCFKHKYIFRGVQTSKYVINNLSGTYIMRNIYKCDKCDKIKIVYLDVFYEPYKSDKIINSDDWSPKIKLTTIKKERLEKLDKLCL